MQNDERLSPEARAALDAVRNAPTGATTVVSYAPNTELRDGCVPVNLTARLEALEARVAQLEKWHS